jgi:histidyl-tRNA synthetase
MTKAKSFSKLPGFRDFPPEELAFRSHIFDAWRRVSRRYGFLEYDGPPLESLDLYVEKSGAEIVEQLYNFTDKGGREVSLRPEMTPSLARILAARSRSLPKPIRWFTVPQLFRYERQQRGRLREHFQWNADVVGEAGVWADAEVVALAIDALRELGLEAHDFRARVSDRSLLSAILMEAGVTEDQLPGAYAAVDKLEREGADRVAGRLTDRLGLTAETAAAVLDVFASRELGGVVDRYGHRPAVMERVDALREFVGALEAMGLGEFVEVDLTIVRGLAYYTGIVFELFDRKGEFRAICGGGRYDRLLELVGGDALPAVGFGMGDVVLGELLRERGLAPDYRRVVDTFVVVIGGEQRSVALEIAHRLRDSGEAVLYALRDASVRKQFQASGTEGARRVIVLGPDEVARGVAVERDMATGTEREVALEELT